MSKLCITTVVDKRYLEYVPLFSWCVKQVYKTYDVKIFLRCDNPYGKVPGVEIIPLFQDFPDYIYNSIALRFVVPPEYFNGYDFVYVTDIDMMIMPERTSIEDFHKSEMVTTGLCYSNSLRNIHHYAGFQSLSGLHFATKLWFEKTEHIRAKYYDLLREGLIGLYREYDGVMLYRMAEKSGIGLPQKYKLKKRHHGIHLGNFRLFDSKEKWADRIPIEYRSQWQQWQADPVFSRIIKECRVSNKSLNNQLVSLDEFIRNPIP